MSVVIPKEELPVSEQQSQYAPCKVTCAAALGTHGFHFSYTLVSGLRLTLGRIYRLSTPLRREARLNKPTRTPAKRAELYI